LKTKNKRLFAVIPGWALVGLGLVGIALPIVPGIPLLLLGLVVLSSEYGWAHQLLRKIRERFPAASRQAEVCIGIFRPRD
jgi:uncharacterized membrane protein YbaN (DUF454 family)